MTAIPASKQVGKIDPKDRHRAWIMCISNALSAQQKGYSIEDEEEPMFDQRSWEAAWRHSELDPRDIKIS